MAERDPELDEDASDAPLPPGFGPVALPAGLRQDWPIPWRANLGKRGGALAWTEAQTVRVLGGGLSRLPRAAQRALVAALARIGRSVDRSHSAAARDFLATALPALDERAREQLVLQAYRHLIQVSLDVTAFDRHVPIERVREHYALEIAPEVERARERGCLLVTGHMGDWEASAAIMPWLGFDPLYVVSRPIRNRYMSIEAQRERERRGIRILPRSGAMADVPAILAARGHVVMLLDQRARHKPLIVPFFGREAACERSPAILARRSSAPIVLGACYATERPFHYRIVIPDVLMPERSRGMTPEEITAWINAGLERRILAAPEQYLWLHDRYRADAIAGARQRAAARAAAAPVQPEGG